MAQRLCKNPGSLKNKNTALLLFTNTPAQEANEKSFAPRQKENLQIANALRGHAGGLARRAGIDYFIIDSSKQQGTTFGQRLAHAIQSVFDKGYEKVIAIGSDCPALSQQLVHKAICETQTNKSVLGQATDGGVYLIGLSKEIFNQENFAAIEWQTERVFALLKNYLDGSHPIFFLPPLGDVDTASDIIEATNKYGFHSIIKVLKGILFSRAIGQIVSFVRTLTSLPRFSFGLKAPPLF